MGMVHAAQTGQIKAPSEKVVKLAKSMTKKSAKDYASTKTKKLPVKVKKTKKVVKENYENKVGPLHVVLKPHPGCDVADLVHEIDPVMGATHKGIDAQTIHGVYGDQDEAMKCAEGLHKDYLDEMKKLEEKKGAVAKKLTSMIDKLESKRKDHMKLAKENPDHAGEHKQHISQIQTKIEDLMDKLENVSKSQKKEEETEEEDGKEKKGLKENSEESKYKVGDEVTPSKGPHKGQKHKVIHVHSSGKYNIKPILSHGQKNKYHLGAASASDEDLNEGFESEVDYSKWEWLTDNLEEALFAYIAEGGYVKGDEDQIEADVESAVSRAVTKYIKTKLKD